MIARLVRLLDGLARRPVVAAMVVAAVALFFAVAASAGHGFPLPATHDELSYLLGAETFASGHLTNPAHPMWRYFETYHVIQQPTYSSKYPPANALFIAIGWVLAGHPIAGVWLSFVFMCAAIHWMLRAWLGEKSALALSIAFASWCATSYWSYSYWGGAVAAGAGALTLGALYRIVMKTGTIGSAFVLGLGLLLLANSRPYEGLLLALPVGLVLAGWLWRQQFRGGWRVVAPLAIVGVAGAFAMGTYNQAVTGNWHELPYSVYQRERDPKPEFLWQSPHEVPAVADRAIEAFNARGLTAFWHQRSVYSRAKYLKSVFTDFIPLLVPVALALPFLLLPLGIRERWTRFAWLTLLWVVGGMGLTTFFYPHYAAPLVGLVLVIYGGSLRWLSRLDVGSRRVGEALAAATVAIWFLAGAGVSAETVLAGRQAATREERAAGWAVQRKLIADTLSRGGRRNLVVVRYGGPGELDGEWVYNAAKIDASPVVWARDKGDPGNAPLLDYFRDRAVWLVQVDSDTGPYRVTRYAPGTE